MTGLRAATVTDLRSRPRYQPDCAALARNRVALARSSAGLETGEFAALLSDLTGRTVTPGHVESWESRTTPPGDVLVAADTVSPGYPGRLGLRSHKLIAGHVPAAAAAALAARPGMADGSYAGMVCRSEGVACPAGPCTLHVFPFGAVVFHLTEDCEFPGVAALASWRVRSYAENLAWAPGALDSMAGVSGLAASYVLSLYWVDRPVWAGRLLETGMRLLCSPRVLLDRDGDAGDLASAEDAERMLLAEGYQHSGMQAFGRRGVSTGFASWSGVSYFPADPGRALGEDELTGFELGLQAAWAYSEHILARLENGQPPDTGKGFGWRFLRGVRARLANPRPTEDGQYQAMREAVLDTSGLPGMLSQAIEALQEDSRP